MPDIAADTGIHTSDLPKLINALNRHLTYLDAISIDVKGFEARAFQQHIKDYEELRDRLQRAWDNANRLQRAWDNANRPTEKTTG